jgi:hypothetical protein
MSECRAIVRTFDVSPRGWWVVSVGLMLWVRAYRPAFFPTCISLSG